MTDDKSASNVSSEPAEPAHEHKRQSMWQATAETCEFLKDAASDKTIVLRDGDRFSSKVLSILLFVGLGAICLAAYEQDWQWLRTRLGAGGFTPFRPINLVVIGAVDVLYFLPLAYFVVNRMGILRTMSKRHALVTWQLMCGASILTALICVNIAVLILLICLGNNMPVLVGQQ